MVEFTKDLLKKEFAKEWEKHYQVKLFKEKGFERRSCKCGKNFWTLDPDRKVCGDSSCEPYGFIGKPITKKPLDYVSMWREFEKFFKASGHASVQRYPVIDRWRPDLFFTIASIQDFQRIDNGKMTFEFPANPLVVPQMCLRFNDIPNVGVTGRHHTSFIMPGQHSFGDYWKDKCMELNFKFLNGVLGIPEKELVYIEDVWAMPDFSAFGPSIECMSRGLELVNHVFMQFSKDAGSEKGYKELPMKVIDTGWGHERLVWFSQGTLTGYDANFGPVIKWMKKETGLEAGDLFRKYAEVSGELDIEESDPKKVRKMIAGKLGVSEKELQEVVEPMQALYAVADHAKSLLFAVADGGIPSNVGGGYNLRVILRRALSFIEEHGFGFGILEVAERHAKFLKPMFPELEKALPRLSDILEVEKERYAKAMEKGRILVKKELKKGISEKILVTLYTSHGISPEIVEKIGKEQGIDVEIPGDIYTKITKAHMAGKKEKEVYESEVKAEVKDVPETRLSYYETPYKMDFQAKVLKVSGKWIILDSTLFYPEGGGQPADKGKLIVGGKERKVLDVQKIENRVLHKLDSVEGISPGHNIEGIIDWDHRYRLMKMHTATHILAGSARHVIGEHIWQAGAQKGFKSSRLDVTHYKSFTREEIQKIEDYANTIVKAKREVEAKFMPRGEAEKEYGFVLYQGGASPGKTVRVVKVKGVDVEACGGTHLKNSEEIGLLKIVKTERLQDGVNRLEYTVAEGAKEFVEKQKRLAKEIAKKVGFISHSKLKTSEKDLDLAAKGLSIDLSQLELTVEKFAQESLDSLGEINKCMERIGKGKKEIQDYFKKEPKNLKEFAEVLFTGWKALQKDLEGAKKMSAEKVAEGLLARFPKRILDIIDEDRKGLVLVAENVIKRSPERTVILANQRGEVVGMSKKEDMAQLVKQMCEQAGGSGGGRPDFAQGRLELSKFMKILGDYK